MRRGAWMAAVVATAVTAAACSASSPPPSHGVTRAPQPPTKATTTSTRPTPAAASYLALGDSVPFGYTSKGRGRDPRTFVGYPELAARTLHLPVTNASCPGETTVSYLRHQGGPQDLCGYWRAMASLHVKYDGPQRDFALAFLRAHPSTRLVSITLGANDLLTCDGRGLGTCRTDVAAARHVFTLIGRNLRRIVREIRSVYRGPLVVVTYYSTDYRRSREVLGLRILDRVVAGVVRAAGGTVADGFTAFRQAAARTHGDACAAGLLAPATLGGCDIHPSRAGARLLAAALVRAYRAAR